MCRVVGPLSVLSGRGALINMSTKLRELHGREVVSITELFAGLRHRLRVIVLLTTVSLFLAVLHVWVVTPEYEARARLIVLAPNQAVSDLQTLELYRNLVPTYREILSSRRVMNAVVAELGLDWTEEEYFRRVRIEANEDTQTLDVFARAPSAEEAARIATGAAQVMTRVVAEVMKDERLVVLDSAVPPKEPVAPRVVLEVTVAAVVGVAIGSFVAGLMEMLDRRIRDERAVERHLGLPVLGVIPHIEM